MALRSLPQSNAALVSALTALRDRLYRLNADVFDHPFFTDRHQDGDENRRFIELANTVLALYSKKEVS